MTKNDFIDWKRHPVTQVMFAQLGKRIQEIYEILGEQAGLNPLRDRELVGAVKAYQDIINIEPEDTEETQND